MNGADVIIASGFEMGGHTHSTPNRTIVLVPAVVAAVDVPVLASGGIVNGAGLAAALAMGASGIAMGTRFIATVSTSGTTTTRTPSSRQRKVRTCCTMASTRPCARCATMP